MDVPGMKKHVLKWERENGCAWNKNTCLSAADNGHLKVLKWARDNCCAWDEKICSAAAKSWHLKVLKWALYN